MVYSNTTVYEGNKYCISGHLHIFTFWSAHLIMLLKCNFFQGFIFTPITDIDSMQGHAAQIIFKVETLLNNAFNQEVISSYDSPDWSLLRVCVYLCMYMYHYVVMKVRSNCAIHNRIDYFNENITCIHYIIIVLLGLYSDTKFH